MKQRFIERPAPGTQAVVRALAILKAFGGARAEWGLTELAAELSLHKTTVFRLLGALEREEFVSRDARRETYRIGPGLIGLGTRALRSTDLHAAAHPVLDALAGETGEAATLEVLVGDEVLILDEVHGRFLVGSTPEIGTRWPAHATSTGKALLAAARFGDGVAAGNAGQQPRVTGTVRGRLTRITPHTITSRAELDRDLAKAWALGYAVAKEEIERGFIAIGAVVRNLEGRAVAAISVGGPSARITSDRIPQLGALARQAADRVSLRLGAPPLRPPGPAATRGRLRTRLARV